MGNKKLISMLMLSAGFVACTDEIVENNYAGNENQNNLVEDVLFNVSLDGNAVTRGQYAGGADGVFKNFYLEPAYDANGNLDLSNTTVLKGDMIGLCLTNGSGQAITNYPFYIAGYGSLISEVENAKDTVYVFADQTYGNELYRLGLTDGQTPVLATKKLIAESVDSMDNHKGNTPLAPTMLDARMGIVRTNTGIMSGKYVAYYPYNDAFAEVGAIPAVKLSAMIEVDGEPTKKSVRDAVNEAKFYDKLFAVSSGFADVTGKTKVGDNLSLTPLTGLVSFNIKNTGTEACEKEIKRITVTATENSEDTDFILAGTVNLDARGTIVATKGETSGLIGVSFSPIAVPATGASDSLFISIPCYPNLNGKKVTVDVYTTDGMVARYNKDAVPTLGVSVVYTIDLKEAKFEATLRKVFNTDDFLAEVVSGGEIELMDNIVVAAEQNFEMSEDAADLVITGGKNLVLAGGNVSKNITMSEGLLTFDDNVVVSGKVVADHVVIEAEGVTGDVEAGRIDVQEELVLTQLLKADELNVNALAAKVETDGSMSFTDKDVTLKYAEVKVLRNLGGNLTLEQDYKVNEYNHYVTANSVYNYAKLNVGYLKANVVENKGELKISGNFNVATVNNTLKDNTGAVVTVTGGVNDNSTVFNNNDGRAVINWKYDALHANVNVNAGRLDLDGSTGTSLKIYGKIVNKSVVNTNKFIALSGTSSVESSGTLNINNNVSIQDGKLNIAGGSVYLKEGAVFYGNSANMAVATGATIYKYANQAEFVNSVIGKSSFEKLYNNIVIRNGSNIVVTEPFTTAKKLQLMGSKLAVAAGTVFAEVETWNDNTLNAPSATAKSITIWTGKLTIENSNIEVEGAVTNKGVYDGTTSVVNCGSFTGTNWIDEVTPNC